MTFSILDGFRLLGYHSSVVGGSFGFDFVTALVSRFSVFRSVGGVVAKEFKEFDKKYSKLAGTALNTIRATGHHVAFVDQIGCWKHIDRFTEDYSMGTINFAVYKAPGAEEWQKFRVSLKGLSCREKLYALQWYWDTHVACGVSAYSTSEDWARQLIRVNNYLGALKRGGFLNSRLEVIKN